MLILKLRKKVIKIKKLSYIDGLLTNKSNKQWKYCIFLSNFFESIVTPDTLLNKVVNDYIDMVKDIENSVYLFNEELDDSHVLGDNLYYDYDYEENDVDCLNSILKLSKEQLKVINKMFPPFEIHRHKTRTYWYGDRMRQSGHADTYLFATLLKSLLIQEEKSNNEERLYGKEETRKFLNLLIYACHFVVKYNK